ncbi:type II toxin-antitoxin system RelE/ParE family toxin [Solidesulfovibrio sp.]|uniref:type II toxin-antitoxin system RelE/ParE family toxin n=1 Tax=Solidesulfovibrio sp. TaxID=2910990 RepID=UPI00263777D4|nr:type II toxin-antitoxin system RelE/ParE family toxin [Solidesulfovibrio sp.]
MRKRLQAVFYRTPHGVEPVREWLKGLDREDRKAVGCDILTVEMGWPIGMPACRPLGKGIFEVRTDISGGRTARVLFCLEAGVLYLLHGFVKKTRKTPGQDLELALQRRRTVLESALGREHGC